MDDRLSKIPRDWAVGQMTMSERQAFVAMRLFIEHFYGHAGNDIETLITDITFEADGQPLDPAAWYDWMRFVEDAKRAEL